MDNEFSAKYIEMLTEEVNAIIKEKVILRAQIGVILDQYQNAVASHQEREQALHDEIETLKRQKEQELQDLENIKNQRENDLLLELQYLKDQIKPIDTPKIAKHPRKRSELTE